MFVKGRGVYSFDLPPYFDRLDVSNINASGGGCLWVFSSVWLQELVPEKMRGRVFAYADWLLTMACFDGRALPDGEQLTMTLNSCIYESHKHQLTCLRR